MERLVIYFHYDRQGVIDTPCRLAVQAMQRYGEVLFVTNGTVETPDRTWVEESGVVLLERENTGFDVGAYRQALLTRGREEISRYDEVVLMNYTLAGPVCDLAPMFAAMETRQDLDFWGLTRHYAIRSRRFGGHVPEHLQSHFLALRSRLLRSDAFWQYWLEMELPTSYEESVIRHETRFTSHFASLGFRWDSFVDTGDLAEIFVNPIMACPRELVANRGCPFFKRRSFFTPFGDELRRTDGTAARELYDYLKDCTDYPVEEVVRALLRDQPLSELARNLHWRYGLSADIAVSPSLEGTGLRLLRWTPFLGDPVTRWYCHQEAEAAQMVLHQAIQLFAKDPLLGVLCPALPLWPRALQDVRRQWNTDRDWVQQKTQLPINDDPPPASHAGWALVRTAAFAQGVPEIRQARDVWLLPLLAQKSGYATAVLEREAQRAAAADVLALYMQAAEEPATLAKQLGRLAKHRLKRR